MNERPTFQRLLAEFCGTLLLVFAGCGTSVLSADRPTADHQQLGVGFFGVAAAFGVTLTVLIYTLGPVSGGHFNPAVTFGLAVAGRFAWRQASYAAAQLTGAVGGAALLYVIAAGQPGIHAAASGLPATATPPAHPAATPSVRRSSPQRLPMGPTAVWVARAYIRAALRAGGRKFTSHRFSKSKSRGACAAALHQAVIRILRRP